MSDPDVVVLRQKIHGLGHEAYAAELRERLPDREVAVAETPERERELVAEAPVVTGFALDEATVRRAGNLRLFACVYSGTGHLPLSAFEEAGVAVTNASGVHRPNIGEHVVGSMVSLARGFPRAFRQQERREWRSFPTRELAGSTVTVVGLGAIGHARLERLEPFAVEPIAVRYTPGKGGPAAEVFGFDEVHEPLSRSDFVVLACPLSDETRGLIDSDALLTMPPDAFLVNVARGGVVVTDDLVSALQGNRIAGAALDVTDPEPLPGDHPLWRFDNVQLTPHNAGHSPAYYERLADIVAENVERAAADRALRNRVV